MRDRKKVFLIVLGLLVLSAGIFFVAFWKINETRAGAGQNVSGFAWSEAIGWLSFNNTSGGGGTNYGVNIESSGVLSGYAWSENIGWISFNEAQLAGCPNGACKAEIDLDCPSDQCPVSGWARACGFFQAGCGGTPEPQAGGWSGWIKLRGVAQDNSSYGVWVDPALSPPEFKGWAWGEINLGWISFNCQNQASCAANNYKVITSFSFNRPPVVSNPLVGSPNSNDYDCMPYPPVRVSWVYQDADGDSQASYQIQVSRYSNFSNIEVDTGQVSGSSLQYVFSESGKRLDFNETYYWRLKAWDSRGKNSGWVIGPSFSTPLHRYPCAEFTSNPEPPHVEEVIQLCGCYQKVGKNVICPEDKVICYNNNQQPISCSGGTFLWTIPADAIFVEGTNRNLCNPKVKFFSPTAEVTLRVTDKDGYGPSSITHQFELLSSVPEWEEIPPY